MKCMLCGKEMINTTGGNYNCPTCNYGVNDLVYRPPNLNKPLPKEQSGQTGWICPVCGRGVAPYMSYCPCSCDLKITYTTTCGSNLESDYSENINYVKENDNEPRNTD